MRKAILTILGSALLVASTVQIAAAAEHYRARKVHRAPPPINEPFRNAWAAPDWTRYEGGAISAPAGH